MRYLGFPCREPSLARRPDRRDLDFICEAKGRSFLVNKSFSFEESRKWKKSY